jgi:hypothetical protein
MKRGLRAPFSTLEQRVEWLLAHQEFLVVRINIKKIVQAMKRDGLFSHQTWWFDVNLDAAVAEARRRMERMEFKGIP